MTMAHHGTPEEESARKRLLDQFLGNAQRAYPKGRMGAEDDGELAFAIATDVRHQTIVIRFGKPVEWIGLDRETAEQLRDKLTEHLWQLRGIKT